MKKIGWICLLLVIFVSIQTTALSVSAADEQQNSAVLNGAHSLNAQKPLLGTEKIVDNTQCAVLYEVGSETLMYAWNSDEQVSPASFVKIITALIVAERGDLTDAVTVKESVLSTVPYDAVSADLQADEVLTVEDLLYCMMVGSANDAAAVLADHLCGSQAAFVAEMNRYVQDLGCVGTNFTNVHGLHDDNQFTTARDAAKILAAAIKNIVFRSVFEAVQYTVPATNKSDERVLVTGNYLMNQNQDSVEIYYDSRVTGGRTGVTSSGYRCIAATAESDGMQLISVVMGCKSVYQEDGYTVQSFGGYKETSTLLDAGFDGYKAVQIVGAEQTVIQCPVKNGVSDVMLGSVNEIYTVLPQEVTSADLDYRYTNIGSGFQAPVEKGQALSELEIWYGDLCIGHVELFALNSVFAQHVQIGTVDQQGQMFSWPVLLKVIVFCGLGFVLTVVIVRAVGTLRLAATRKRSRQHRRNRRRSR